LRIFENRVLTRIFGPNTEEVAGGWRGLHNEELHNLYASPYVIRRIKSRRMTWAEHVARMEEMTNSYKILVRKPEGKRPLRKPSARWEDNMDLRKIVCVGVDWMHLSQNRDKWQALVNMIMILWVT
jgi:hypothetical protein